MRAIWISPLVAFLLTANVPAQTAAAQSDPQAIALAAQSITALTGGVSISNVILSGTATRTAGSTVQTGPATLTASGTGLSRIELQVTPPVKEIRNGMKASYFYGADQAWHAMAMHNCFTDAVWFFPAFSSLSPLTTSTGLQATYVGQEQLDGLTVAHIQVTRPSSRSQLVTHLTTVDFYLDSSSLLPVKAKFNTHPDANAAIDILLEIRFSDYRPVSGAQIPFHIQKFINGGIGLDFVVSTATINLGVQPSTFTPN
jgi:hypothetical protein